MWITAIYLFYERDSSYLFFLVDLLSEQRHKTNTRIYYLKLISDEIGDASS